MITALKDEGAANSFITKGLVDLCRLESELLNDKGDSEDLTGPDGTKMKIIGTIRNAKL